MKKTKGVLAIALSLVMALALSSIAYAQTVTVGGGSGSISVTNATVGETYSIYKLFDATVSPDGANIAYTTQKVDLNAGGVDGSQWFTVAASGKVEGTASLDEAALKSADFKKWAEAYGTKVGDSVVASDSPVTFSEIPYGYYYVTSSLGGVVTITSTMPSASVVDKNQGSAWEGKVVIDNQGGKHKAHVAAFDEDIKFDIGVSATNFSGTDKVYRYLVTDVLPAGMSYKDSTLEVKVGDTVVNPIDQQADTGYKVLFFADAEMTKPATGLADAQAFKVYVPWTTDNTADGNHLYASSASLHVSYTAFLDSTKAGQVDYNNPNVNTAKYDYFLKGEDYGDVDPNHGIPTSTTNSYISELNVSKFYYVNQIETPLSGAEFTLKRTGGFSVSFTQEVTYEANDSGAFWKLNDGTYTMVDPAGAGVDQSIYASTTQKYAEKVTRVILRDPANAGNVKAFVDKDGNVIFSGLIEGDYTLEETVVPAGYNKANNISFKVKFTEDIDPVSQEPTGTGTWSEESGSDVVYNTVTNRFEVSVENRSGIMLPLTGGMGIALLTLAGVALLAVGAVSYLAYRRSGKAQY